MAVGTIVAQDNVGDVTSFNDPRLDYQQDGTLWAVLELGNPVTAIAFFYSKDKGATWTRSTSSDITTMNGGGGGTSFFIDKDDYAHVVYYDDVETKNVYRLGTPNGEHTAWTWSSVVAIQGTFGPSSSTFSSVVAHREGTGWTAHAIVGELSAGILAHVHYSIPINSSHVPGSPTGTTIKNWGTSLSTSSSLDFRHTATDPKDVQSSTPSLYLVMVDYGGAVDPGLIYYKATYSAGSWTWGAEVEITTAQQSGLATLVYDGTRVMITGMNTATTDTVRVWERDEANTTTTSRDPPALSLGTIVAQNIGMGRNGDVWVAVAENTNRNIYYNRFNRGGLSWGSWTLLADDATPGPSDVSVMRGMSPSGLGVMYNLQSASPDTILFDFLFQNHEAEAVLQGVGDTNINASLGINSAASLQAVGSLSPQAAVGHGAAATLQGVGSMDAKGLLTPYRDFTVYDAYLDGLGLFGPAGIIYYEDEQAKKNTVSQQLQPSRQDVGNQPTEVRPEQGEVFSQQDFSHGAGQLYYHSEGRDVKRYLWSEGYDVDIDTVGRPATLTHQQAVAQSLSSTAAGKIVVFDGSAFVIDGTTIKKHNGILPGSWSDDGPHAGETATTPQDMSSSGEYLYAALGANGIHRRDTAGNWAHWSDVQATLVGWVKNRIMAADGPSIYEVITSGAAPTPIETLPAGWAFESIFEVSGFVYATAVNRTSELSRIHAYKLNTAGTALEKKSETPFPRDQLIISGSGYLDNVLLGGGIKTPDGGFDPVVYQAGVSDQDSGSLTYAKIAEGEGAGAIDLSVKAFEARGENVVFGWSLGSGFAFGARDGLALLKLKVGGFFPYLKTAGAGEGRVIESVSLWNGILMFTVKGKGVYYEDATKLVSEAYLISSVADYNTTSRKIWDWFQVSHELHHENTTVALDYTTKLPTEGVWTDLQLVHDSTAEVHEVRADNIESRILAVRIRTTSTPDQSEAPEGLGFLVRSNLLPDTPEWNLTRYVRIMKRDRKDGGGEDVFIDDVHEMLRDFQQLAYRIVNLYEPGVTWTVRLDRIADMTPFLPRYWETVGEERREVFILQLSMSGVRD